MWSSLRPPALWVEGPADIKAWREKQGSGRMRAGGGGKKTHWVTTANRLEARITSRPVASILPEQGLGRCKSLRNTRPCRARLHDRGQWLCEKVRERLLINPDARAASVERPGRTFLGLGKAHSQ